MKFLGPAVTGEKPFENVDRKLTCALWPRSPNDLDLKNFIVVEFERTVVSKSTIATKNPFFDFFQSNGSLLGHMTRTKCINFLPPEI